MFEVLFLFLFSVQNVYSGSELLRWGLIIYIFFEPPRYSSYFQGCLHNVWVTVTSDLRKMYLVELKIVSIAIYLLLHKKQNVTHDQEFFY